MATNKQFDVEDLHKYVMVFNTRYIHTPDKPFIAPDSEKSKTVQSVYPTTTVKFHLDRFQRTGIWGDPLSTAKMKFADVSTYPSFQDVHTKLSYAKSLYQSLSPDDQQQFSSDIDFVRFLTDEGNKDDALWKEAQQILSGQSADDLFDFGESIAEGETDSDLFKPKEAASAEGGNDSAADGTEPSE